MKILHIIKTDPEESVKKIIEEHKRGNDVEVIDIRNNKDYYQIIKLIEWSDKVISW